MVKPFDGFDFGGGRRRLGGSWPWSVPCSGGDGAVGGERPARHPDADGERLALQAAAALLLQAGRLQPVGHLVYLEAGSEEHTSELQSLMRISYAVFCLKKNKTHTQNSST